MTSASLKLMTIIIISSNMTILGLSGDATHVKITNQNEARTDPPAITAIVRIGPP